MSLINQNISVVQFTVQCFPGEEKLTCNFDINKSFRDLKNELQEKYKMKQGTYYLEMNGHVIDDDVTLKDQKVENNSCINAVRNGYVIIRLEFKDDRNEIQMIQKCILKSDLKVIKPNQNKIAKV